MRRAAALAALAVALALTAGAVAGCRGSAPGDPVYDRVERAWARGLAFLAAQQDRDGGVRSKTYGVLRPGCSLTAVALYALARAPDRLRDRHAAARARALAFLAVRTDANGRAALADGTDDYPNYTAALHLLALVRLRPERWQELAQRLVGYLRGAQLGPGRGWSRDDVEFGGFAFGGAPAKKPLDAELLSLSVTCWAVEALAAAGVAAGDPVFADALVFVERCRNADGGFAFTTAPEPHRSKAGLDQHGRPRSYGSATCDGVRALLACGVPLADARVQGALAWLCARLDGARVPGFPADQLPQYEPALRQYYQVTLGAVLARTGGDAPLRAALRDVLLNALLDTQRDDGAWAGGSDLMKEDDPLVATPLALIALAELSR